MSNLLTDNPIALQALMNETLFSAGFVMDNAQNSSSENLPSVNWDSSSEEFVYKGDKSAGILFILRYPDYPYFSPEAEEAFVMTIAALGLTLENVAVVYLSYLHNSNDFICIRDFFS